MNQLGDKTKSLLHKGEPFKMRHSFIVKEVSIALLFSADFVTSNKINGSLNGVAYGEVTFATDHATTLAALATSIAALPGVKSATSATRTVTVILNDQTQQTPTLTGVVTLGASQATSAATVSNLAIKKGMPVKLTTDGKITPASTAENPINIIGHAEHNSYGYDQCTVSMRAQAIFYAEAGIDTMLAGPVKYASFTAGTGRARYSSTSVDYTNAVGWSLTATATTGNEILVALL